MKNKTHKRNRSYDLTGRGRKDQAIDMFKPKDIPELKGKISTTMGNGSTALRTSLRENTPAEPKPMVQTKIPTPKDHKQGEYVNVGSTAFTPWRATAQDIREFATDFRILSVGSSIRDEHNEIDKSPQIVPVIDRTLSKAMDKIGDMFHERVRAGKLIWFDNLQFFYDDGDFWAHIITNHHPENSFVYVALDNVMAWNDDLSHGTHMIMSWFEIDILHIVVIECVKADLSDPSFECTVPGKTVIACTGYFTVNILSTKESSGGKVLNVLPVLYPSYYLDEDQDPETNKERAKGTALNAINMCRLFGYLLEANDAKFVREPAQRRGLRKPLASYRTIRPDGYVTVLEALHAKRVAREAQGGHHASPVPHDRRGTWVTSRSGNKFWRKGAKVLGGAEAAAQQNLPIRGHYEVRT